MNRLMGTALVAAIVLIGCQDQEEVQEIELPSEKNGAASGSAGDSQTPAENTDTVESIAGELKAKILEFAVVVRSASDEATARVAADRLKALGGEVEEIAERLAKLEVPAEDVRRRLGREIRGAERKVETEMRDAEGEWQDLGEDANRIMGEGFGAFGAKMGPLKVVFDEYFAHKEPGG